MHRRQYAGLAAGEVASRQQAGLVNRTDSDASRSLADILRGNILTPFNALITALAVVVLVVNRNPINSLFFIAMLLNAVIGIIQELKAKAVLDKLVIVTKPRVKVVRDGQTKELDAGEIVQDDLITVERGDQVVVDGEVIQSAGLEVDESLLTGEADSIAKPVSSRVLSGSLVVAGDGLMRATKVGRDSYAAKLSKEAKQFHRASSELVEATNRIMKWIAWLMFLVVPILIIGQLRIGQGNWSEAVVHTVAAIVGMIPEGLVLLTSMAFLLAVVRLAKQQVLVQQLPAVET
ncbi:cation-translocating P-type ATPase, partial [Candidatus Saccharibacteria bacterium]|nr:cation-translocating P-type ATPase [Candidatus Saccharibacteria bacterium]